jgi:hypothetical protein
MEIKRSVRWGAACLAAVALLGSAAPSSAANLVSSTFGTGVDGWSALGDTSAPASWVSTGGHPGGSVQVSDTASGGVMFWVAPAKFLGDKGAAYGGRLGFDLRQSDTSSQFDDQDVVLQGGGMTLVYDTAVNPGTTFTRYRVPLTPVGWHENTLAGPQPTVAEFRSVLGSLTGLRIRAEYRTGPDVDDIDTVLITTPPETTITSGPAEGSTTADPTPTFTFASSEPAGARFLCRLSAGATATGDFVACNAGSFTSAPLADGPYTFQVRTTGPSGVDTTPETRHFTVDAP